MALLLPADLPARRLLEQDGVPLIDRPRPERPPLRIGLLNLMPAKAVTEAQFGRLLARTDHDVQILLVAPATHAPRHQPEAHVGTFYRSFEQVARQPLDGLIVTGAPVEILPFEEVDYWDELAHIIDAAPLLAASTLYVCWAGQAALFRHHGVPKHTLPRKLSGVYPQRRVMDANSLARGLPALFPLPVSRRTEVRATDLPNNAGLEIVVSSPSSGLCLLDDPRRRAIYQFNHPEYGAGTLRDEYRRDRDAGLDPDLPCDYFPADDPDREPVNSWRTPAQLLYANWTARIAGERERSARGTVPPAGDGHLRAA